MRKATLALLALWPACTHAMGDDESFVPYIRLGQSTAQVVQRLQDLSKQAPTTVATEQGRLSISSEFTIADLRVKLDARFRDGIACAVGAEIDVAPGLDAALIDMAMKRLGQPTILTSRRELGGDVVVSAYWKGEISHSLDVRYGDRSAAVKQDRRRMRADC
ncbi:hypothetical protein JNW90_34630 [Micromonospora sp. STR1s_5]|nr:hypothetical protein [Micromonospora sp. STR1s_5]